MSLPMTYIYLSDLIRMDGPCLKPTDKDKAGRLCGKRAVTGGLTAGSDKAKQAAAKFRAEKYGKKGQSPQQQGINKIPVKPSPGGALVQKGGALAVREKAREQPKPKSTGDKDLDQLIQKSNIDKSDVSGLVKDRAKKLKAKDLDDIAQRSTELDFLRNRTTKDLRQAKIEVARDAMAYTFNKMVEQADREIVDTEGKLKRTKSNKTKASLQRKIDRLKSEREADAKRAEAAKNLSDDEALKRGEERFQSDKSDQLERFKRDKEVAAAADIGSRVGLGADRLREANWGASSGGQDAFDLITEKLQSKKAQSSTFSNLGDSPAEGDLKKAYRAAAAKAHPDRGGTKEAFQQLNAEYEAERRRLGFDSLIRGDALNWAPWADIAQYCDDYIYI